jgi:hypothetical protein
MTYTAATDVHRFGWQTKQFVIDPNAQTRSSILDCLAYPATAGIAAEANTPATEQAADPGGGGDEDTGDADGGTP